MTRRRFARAKLWLLVLAAAGCETVLGLNATEPSLLDAGGMAGSAGTGVAGGPGLDASAGNAPAGASG